ncbi:probable serine/threonine-protein kinase DDB_G0282963 [Oppia nitens]|uniref:probable serine/threonine-protein kinase DDB_G0282963 n=1 Tax=Oppia nitens TaxID=1686743 RepID=UPI0023DA5FDD|nr:probable serine/threonine-protein kinase DDB_G0282963 [Oppia nitens]
MNSITSYTLQAVIECKTRLLAEQPDNGHLYLVMNMIECHIFRSILECVDNFHTMNPPVIHRDLRPENILLAVNSRNEHCIIIGNTGLATIHEFSTQSHTAGVGSGGYQAPEVANGRNYDTQADVYSLSIIFQHLFNCFIWCDSQQHRDEPPIVTQLHQYLRLQFNAMMNSVFEERPSCAEILMVSRPYLIDFGQFTDDPEVVATIQWLYKNGGPFFHSFLHEVLLKYQIL